MYDDLRTYAKITKANTLACINNPQQIILHNY